MSSFNSNTIRTINKKLPTGGLSAIIGLATGAICAGIPDYRPHTFRPEGLTGMIITDMLFQQPQTKKELSMNAIGTTIGYTVGTGITYIAQIYWK